MYKSIMHVSFYTDKMEEMIEFYQKLGAEIKTLTRFKVYKNATNRPYFQKIANESPEKIFNVYLEIAPGQFIELFPEMGEMKHNEAPWNSQLGYTHFALLCDDIFAEKKRLEEKGIKLFTEPSKGPSETWQMWVSDPDGNMFEIMQYTENSTQVKGHID